MMNVGGEKAFNYNSIYNYSNSLLNFNDSDSNDYQKRNDDTQNVLYYIIVSVFYFFLFITFPFSAWFCIKKVHSLQRCVMFRLGYRLPIKGPGLIIKFPLIDSIEIVDLNDHTIEIANRKQEFLTNDGSIVEFISVCGQLNVVNAVRSSTQLKDAKFNCEQFVKLAFVNMIASSHLEDLERNPDIMMGQFEENCNIYLSNWGWELKIIDIPKFNVHSRANPASTIMSKLKGLFNSNASDSNDSNGSNGSNQFFDLLMNFQNGGSNGCSSPNKTNDKTLNGVDAKQSDLISPIQKMASKYSDFIKYDIFIEIQVKELDLVEYYKLSHETSKVSKTNEKPIKSHIMITAESYEDLMDFCHNEKFNKVKINTSLD